jgi:hypothetical protein
VVFCVVGAEKGGMDATRATEQCFVASVTVVFCSLDRKGPEGSASWETGVGRMSACGLLE